MRKILLVQRDKRLESQLGESPVADEYELLSAPSIREGKSLLDSDQNIDLVIADLRLGDGSGLELLHYTRSRSRLSFIPVVITSGSYNREEVIRCGELGAAALVTLPVETANLQKRIEAVVRDGKRTVLVVDDDEVILDILGNMLELERFRVVTATGEPEALRALQEHRVHAVVSDVLMPESNGIELLKKVKADYSNIPVILITGYSGKYSPRYADSCGADGFLTKPFRNLELVKLLRDVISRAERRAGKEMGPAKDPLIESVKQS